MSFSDYTLVLKNDGTLWGCGRNDYGQLSLGDTRSRTTFTKIITNTNDVKLIHCGNEHTLILKNNGTLWGCGWNKFSQLGLGDTNNKNVFTIIGINSGNIKEVYLGGGHTLILKNDGTLWGSGYNDFGQLGLGDTTGKYTFTQIVTNVDDIKSVHCACDNILVLKNDGTLWGCGYNGFGQLGLGDTNNRTTLTQITSNINDIKSVYCGSNYTVVLKNDDTLWGSGWNNYGQLGLGDTNNRKIFTQITTNINNIKSVYCGKYHTLILKNDGTLWGSGNNGSGQLGLGGRSSKTTFTQVTTNVDNIKAVYCGFNHTLILKNDGTLWGCGSNTYGQLGLGDTTNITTFTQITTNIDDIKCFANDYNSPNIIKIYDSKIGYTETLDTNNFRNIPKDLVKKLKVLYTMPENSTIHCLISFDKKQTWKTFDGLNWNTISDISPENIILNCMSIGTLNQLDKNNLISGGFTGDLDFKIAMKTNDKTITSSITKIYIEYE